jgi:hypothetical protein
MSLSHLPWFLPIYWLSAGSHSGQEESVSLWSDSCERLAEEGLVSSRAEAAGVERLLFNVDPNVDQKTPGRADTMFEPWGAGKTIR